MREESSSKAPDFLDRPILGGIKLTWWTLAYAVLVGFILATRFWDLGARAYCHDESIHAWESWKLATGQGYQHSPVYHGPFGYHVTALCFILFGNNDVTGRLAAVLFATAITILPIFLRKWLGSRGVLTVMFLMAISPVMMHRSRYIRHDQFALFFNLLMFIGLLRYLDKRKTRDLYLTAGALAAGYTTKETTFITYAIFVMFLVGLYVWQLYGQWRRRDKINWSDLPVFDLLVVIGTLSLPLASPFPIKMLGGNPVDYTAKGITFSAIVFVVVLLIGVAIGMWWDWRRWAICAGIFYAIFVPLYTTMFTNGQGFATGMVGSLGYWLSQQGVKRGGQPWYYYLVLMPLYEFFPLVLAAAGTVFYPLTLLRKRDTRALATNPEKATSQDVAGSCFVPFLIFWAWAALVIYSWAGEKMPWLCMQLAVPLHLLAGWTLSRILGADWRAIRAKGGLWLLVLVPLLAFSLQAFLAGSPSRGTSTQEISATIAWLGALAVTLILGGFAWAILRKLDTKDAWRSVGVGALVVLTAATIRFAWMAAFINGDVATEFLVYAQGTPDTALVTRELQSMSRRLSGDLSMKVAYDDDSSWPFVWYLRNFTNAQFYGKKPAGPFDAEAVIVGPENEAAVKPLLGNKYYRRQYRLVWWPNQDWYANWSAKKLWQDLTDPVTRRKVWDVIWNRKYDASLTSWPFVHNFALYVRRDVAQQLWNYGPDALIGAAPMPADDYVNKWKQVPAMSTFGSLGNQPGQMRAPKGLALDAEGNIYVADSQNHRIQVFDPSGRFLRQWGSEGNAPGTFKEPWGVGVAPSGEVYVADTWNHRIQVFDSQGAYKRMWGAFGESGQASGPGTLLYGPRDIACDAQGNIFVADTGNKRVVKYDPQGNMLGAVGGVGDGDGQLQEPVGIAVARDGSLYVADTWNQRIQVFDALMRYVRQWPFVGWDGMSVVNKPYAALDDQGNTYLTDPEGYRVVKFDRDGKVASVWGQHGSDLSSMNLPTGIKLDATGRVLVVDSDNNRILVFAPMQ